MTFRSKITLSFLLIFGVTISVIIAYFYKSFTRTEQNAAVTQISENTLGILENIEQFIHDCESELRAIGTSQLIAESTDREYLNRRLIAYRNIYQKYDRICLYDDQGVVLADSGGLNIGEIQKNFCWKEAMTGKTGFHITMIDDPGSAIYLHFHAGMKSKMGRINRVVTSCIPVTHINEFVKGFSGYNKPDLPPLQVQLIDNYGRILYSNLTKKGVYEIIVEWENLKTVAESLSSEKRECKIIADKKDVSFIARSLNIHENKNNFFLLYVKVPKSLLFGETRRRGIMMAIFALLMMNGSFLIIWFMSGTFSRPVTELVQHARMLAIGDFSKIKNLTERSDEFGELVHTFKGMAEKIEITMATIRKLNMELEQRVIQRTAQLEASNKEMEAFSYSVSHDLRAPLRAINSYAHILTDEHGEQLGTEARRLLDIISNQSDYMGKLIDDLLSFFRLGRQQIQISEIDMTAMVQSVYAELMMQEKGRRIEFRLNPLPPVHGDSSMIHQMWMNLLSNAIKFTRKKEVSVIEVGSLKEGNETVYYVKDNGAGFDMKYANKLFGVFQRLHRQEEFEGTGVGLALVQRIVHRHGGRIWAESKINEGALFKFTLQNIKEKSV